MLTDSELKKRVEEELEVEPSVTATDIGVTVKGGVVTLAGTVGTYGEKWAAERAAERVSGMQALAQELKVRLGSAWQRTDADIAAAALHALRWDVQVPDARIKVEVENGTLTLKGEVDWNFQRVQCEQDVRNLAGVKNVFNEITIKRTVPPTKVHSKIESALQRAAVLDARHIQVETDGGKVVLRGEVKSWVERQEAERAAWQIAGVNSVQDFLVVHP